MYGSAVAYSLGVVSITFGRIHPRESFARAAALGFAHVDVNEQELAVIESDHRPPLPPPSR